MFESLKTKTAMLAGAALLVTSLAASMAPASAHEGDRYDHKTPAISQNQDQDSFGNDVTSYDLQDESEIEDNAFRHATGVMQVNQASGVGNQQDNQAYIDGGDKSKKDASSMYGGRGDNEATSALDDHLAQDAAGNRVSDHNGLLLGDSIIPIFLYEAANETSIEDNAFRHATGLVQVNQAAGNLNQNGNEAVITDDDLSSSKVRLHQGLFENEVCSGTDNSATISNYAFANFKGVAQVNQASGDLNQNKNQLSVAR
jgi:hypothetical protein